MRLTDVQIERLLRPIHPNRVHQAEGFSHVEAFDIRAMLIRIFGFAGWSLTETSPPVLIYEKEQSLKSGKAGYAVAYRAHLALTIHTPEGDATYSGSAVGESIMPDFKRGDCHDMAIKTAESQALKRCATNLGDQFGLSLYNDGSTQAYVQTVFGYTPQQAEAEPQPVAAPSPPPEQEQAPAPAESVPQPAAGAGEPSDFDNAEKVEALAKAVIGLSSEEKRRLTAWGRERKITNVMRPPADKVDMVLARCEELVAGRG